MIFKWSVHTFFIAHITILLAVSNQPRQSQAAAADEPYSDYWLIKINGNFDDVKQLAKEHNFKLLDQVGSLDGYYHVKLDSSARHRRSEETTDHVRDLTRSESVINAHPSVEMFMREKSLRRIKRDFIEEELDASLVDSALAEENRRRHLRHHQHHFLNEQMRRHKVGKREDPVVVAPASSYANLLDPYWDKMWYLNRNTVFHSDSPDMNVTGAWDLGFSGRGASVTFLDDGLEWDHPDIKQNYVSTISVSKYFK